MALIDCTECGSEISDQAKACPKCGFPMEAIAQPSGPSPEKSEAAAPVETGMRGQRCLKKGMIMELIGLPILLGGIVTVVILISRGRLRSWEVWVVASAASVAVVWLVHSLVTWLAARGGRRWAPTMALIRLIAIPLLLGWFGLASVGVFMALLLPPVGLPLMLPYVLTFVAEIYLLKGTIRVWRSRVAYRSA